MDEPRYFVDERCGCLAVRDRELTDPEYQGLHHNTTGVVRYWHGKIVEIRCDKCGHIVPTISWEVAASDVEAAQILCDELNNPESDRPFKLQDAGGGKVSKHKGGGILDEAKQRKD